MRDTTAMIKLIPGHTECVVRFLNNNSIRHEVKDKVLFIYADYAEDLIRVGMFIQKLKDESVRNTG